MAQTRFIDLNGLKYFVARLKQFIKDSSPKNTSELENDIGALLTADVGALGNMRFIGNFTTEEDLPPTAQTADVCKVSLGNYMIYDGKEWIDLFIKPDVSAISYKEIKNIFEGVSNE